MFGPLSIKIALLVVIVIGFILFLFSLKKLKKNSLDFDTRLNLDKSKLSKDKIKIQKKYGFPLEIKYQESVDNTLELWIFPENIVTFNEDETLRKVI